MSIKEKVKNNKIAKDQLDYVLRIIEVDYGSLCGCYQWIKYYREEVEKLKLPEKKMKYDTNTLLEIHSLSNRMVMHYQVIFAQNAFDFYEFFYKKCKSKEGGYYHFQFPVDRKKFKKMRVSEKELLKAMKKMGDNEGNKRIRDLTGKNIEAFYDCMKARVKRPTIESDKKIVDHYLKKINIKK